MQTLVDFTRPRDLHLEEVDLRRLSKTSRNLPLPMPSSMASPLNATCPKNSCRSRPTLI